MEVDYDDVVAIVDESKTRLRNATYMHCGSYIDLYKFSNKDTRGWKRGHIFLANSTEDLSFNEGILGDIKARDAINTREAFFLVHAPNEEESVQDMMNRSSTMKHIGILKPYIVGTNTQISQVVSGFSVPTSSLTVWLSKLPVEGPYIPNKVQQLIRIGYLAINHIWSKGSTSDQLADIRNYHMIDNNLKINPLCTRKKKPDERNMLPLRRAFAQMIEQNICSKWGDGELQDFLELLRSPAAREVDDILEHPVLLSPPRREIMYRRFDRTKATLSNRQKNWVMTHVDPDWKTQAEDIDKALKSIIRFQASVGQQAAGQEAAGQEAAGQQAAGFSTNCSGALRFASVTTSHYLRHYKEIMTEGNWREDIKGRVDWLLKTVLPRLLSRCYNAKYFG